MSPPDPHVRVLVISGSMGAGKTTVLGEASDILTALNIPHAAIDLDLLGLAHLPPGAPDDLTFRNLEAVWRNYLGTGVRRLLIAGAVESADRPRLRQALCGASILTCRLTAGLETMRQRVRSREPGMLQEAYVARVAELEARLNDARAEDFSISNEARPVTDVARAMLALAGWL
jgi:predicted kinase